jgi:P pilus assembly chaperone PapD
MKSILFRISILLVALFFSTADVFAQAGITASPSRLFFSPGNKSEQTITVVNPSSDKNLEVGITLNDWKYDSLGSNVIYTAGELDNSCAKYIKILPSAFFTLAPGESKNVIISTAGVPEDANVPVRTAMLYLTQLNPGDGKNENGAAIKVTVRMGIKIYYSAKVGATPELEITNLETKDEAGAVKGLRLNFDNTGQLWASGTIKFEFLNKGTGKKYKLDPVEFYTLPGDKRIFDTALPKGMDKGKYTTTAIINYGQSDELKIAEIDFDY